MGSHSLKLGVLEACSRVSQLWQSAAELRKPNLAQLVLCQGVVSVNDIYQSLTLCQEVRCLGHFLALFWTQT